jgi:hypothetical protein
VSVGHHHGEYEADEEGFHAALGKDWFLREYIRPPRVDPHWDIPYVGGVSLDNSVVFVDRQAFGWIVHSGFLPGLVEHEHVEGILMRHGWEYWPAHYIANAAEQAKYRKAGIDPKSTEPFYNALIRKAGDETITHCPPDLNLEPYKGDRRLAAIKAAQATGGAPTFNSGSAR